MRPGPTSTEKCSQIDTSTLRRRYPAPFHQHRHSGGQQTETTASGRRLAPSLPSHSTRASEWETLCYKLVEMNKSVNVRHPSGNHMAKTFWKVRAAKERGEAYCDQTCEQKIVDRFLV